VRNEFRINAQYGKALELTRRKEKDEDCQNNRSGGYLKSLD
jgi:hypothetical protein